MSEWRHVYDNLRGDGVACGNSLGRRAMIVAVCLVVCCLPVVADTVTPPAAQTVAATATTAGTATLQKATAQMQLIKAKLALIDQERVSLREQLGEAEAALIEALARQQELEEKIHAIVCPETDTC